MGFGTEKVESEIAKFFPKARIVRLDADTTRKKDAHELILSEFRDRKVDILIGTQMIAKGFDFPHVTLVGVVLADVGLRLPDFRSGERTFQLLTQFAGRAGRGSKPGRVLIQTCMPDHPSVALAKNHDFLGFYAHETRLRRDFKYPPYCSLINIIIRSRTENKAYQFAREMRDALREKLRDSFPRTGPASQEASPESQSEPFGILGPAPLPFYKLRGHFRWHIMLKLPLRAPETGSKGMPGVTEIYKLLMGLKKPSSVAFAIDVDPLNIL
jgi:primosomal protein N' (replication factor Y)